ncbi:MAG: hypothetical protein ACI9FN_002768 [Saprospiraceae bacterium]|jgi:hypothetical protein
MKTEDLLQKFVTQGLSKEERFELEKRALEDDFLADAWEGLQVHQGSDLRQKWNAIQSEWQNKHNTVQNRETKVVAMEPWMRYAAAAAVLLLGAALFFMRSGNPTFEGEGVLALDPIEVSEDQSYEVTTENLESIETSSDEHYLADREEAQKEKSPLVKAEKITVITKTSKEVASTESIPEKTQAPTSQKNRSVAFVAKIQPELGSSESKNSLVRATPTLIQNPEPPAENKAAIPLDKKVKGFGIVEIENVGAPLVTKVKNIDNGRQKSGSQFDKSKEESEAVNLDKSEEDKKLKGPLEEVNLSSFKTNDLKKNILGNSISGQTTDQIQSSLQKARGLFLKDKDYEGARDEALNAIALNSNLSEGYELIGDIYAAASHTCNQDDWSHSLAAIAAFEKYKKALSKRANTSNLTELQNKLSALQDRFPTKEKGFLRGVKLGDTSQVGCWIDETVTVRYKN